MKVVSLTLFVLSLSEVTKTYVTPLYKQITVYCIVMQPDYTTRLDNACLE